MTEGATTESLRGVCVGAGYFSRFHYGAWQRIPNVEIVANCDLDLARASAIADDFSIGMSYSADQFEQMLDVEKPDFVDLITPPSTHLELCKLVAERGVHLVCQKPLAPTYEETLQLASLVRQSTGRFMVHENWRWQPWYREIKRILDSGEIGKAFHLAFQCRLGDGWGDDAYMARQPFFRDYRRLFIFETGVHFLDTFRFLFGEMESIFASIARRNPMIKGEDCAVIHCKFGNDVTAILDANRYNEVDAENPRYTFGTLRLDASGGHLELDSDGRIKVKQLGEPSRVHSYRAPTEGFCGDCVFAVQSHFVDCLTSGEPFESGIDDYLKSVNLVEAAYRSAASDSVIPCNTP